MKRKIWIGILLDLPASMLPALFVVGAICYTAWANWWVH